MLLGWNENGHLTRGYCRLKHQLGIFVLISCEGRALQQSVFVIRCAWRYDRSRELSRRGGVGRRSGTPSRTWIRPGWLETRMVTLLATPTTGEKKKGLKKVYLRGEARRRVRVGAGQGGGEKGLLISAQVGCRNRAIRATVSTLRCDNSVQQSYPGNGRASAVDAARGVHRSAVLFRSAAARPGGRALGVQQ